MNYTHYLIILFFWGALLGAFFFGGLWLTVRKGLHAKSPALLFGVSLLVRILAVLAGFYLAINGFSPVFGSSARTDFAQNPLYNIAASMTGFLVSRMFILRYTDAQRQ